MCEKERCHHTMGHIEGRARVMENETIFTGRKSKILGYISKGESVYINYNYYMYTN